LTRDEEVRNQAIDEMCDWLESCLQQVDHGSEVFKACTAMVRAMRGKKTVEPEPLPISMTQPGLHEPPPGHPHSRKHGQDTSYPDEQHFPLGRGGTFIDR
jgi:hypothetical protein